MENQDYSEAKRTRKVNFFSLSFLSVVIGACLAFYATIHHVQLKKAQATNAMCNINQIVNCDKVAQSPYSEFLSIPLGVWGGGFFLTLLAFLIWGYGEREDRRAFLSSYGILVSLGSVASLILAFVSFGLVKAVCLICIGIYLCNFLQTFVFWKMGKKYWDPVLTWSEVRAPILIMIFAFGLSLSAYYVIKPRDIQVTPANIREKSAKIQKKKDPNQGIVIHKSAYSGFGEDYRKGSDQARVVIHEFADFQCPACREMSKLLQEVQSEVGSDKLLIVFRNFPLDSACNPEISQQIHPLACQAAKIARCGGRIGKFWEFHDAIFANQDRLSESVLKQEALRLGLDEKSLDNCLQDQSITAKLRSDSKDAIELQVQGTPTLFINGKPYDGAYSKSDLVRKIRSLL